MKGRLLKLGWELEQSFCINCVSSQEEWHWKKKQIPTEAGKVLAVQCAYWWSGTIRYQDIWRNIDDQVRVIYIHRTGFSRFNPSAAETGILWAKYVNAIAAGALGAVSIRKTVLPGMAIPMLKIRRPNDRLIFNMGIAIPGKTVFLIETAPWQWSRRDISRHGFEYVG